MKKTKGIEHQTYRMRADRATDFVDSIEMGQAIERLSKRLTKLEKLVEYMRKRLLAYEMTIKL
jgi:hypothetical protein